MEKGRVNIKICGITDKREIDRLIELGVDYAGFVVFFEKSKRNNTVEAAAELVRYVRKEINSRLPLKTVAVTVSPTVEQLNMINDAGFDIIQIHGELSEEVKEKAALSIWRAFNLSSYENEKFMSDELKKIVSDEKISGIVFDGASYGSGETFKWDTLKNADVGDKLFILAGGLNPGNVSEAVEILKPDVADVSSGVEYDDKSVRGKDLKKVEDFVQAVQNS